MQEVAFKLMLGVVVVLQWAIRFYFQNRYKTTHAAKVTERKPARERALVAYISLSFILPTLIWWFTPWMSFAQMALSEWLRFLGFGIALYGIWYFYCVHKQLGDNWSPVLEVRQGHQLVTSGVYQNIRHPMYTSLIVGAIGCSLLSANWLMLLVNITAIAVLCIIRLPDEERLMTEQFGEEYRDYQRQTWGLIPGVW